MNIAVIPARGGSKRIPKKNVREFFGRPVMCYALETAFASRLFDRIVVSTDDNDVAAIAVSAGAEVIQRPAELADDYATTAVVLEHALKYHKQYTMACCIYPCTPFLTALDLRHGLDRCPSLAVHFSSAYRALKMADDGTVSSLYPEYRD